MPANNPSSSRPDERSNPGKQRQNSPPAQNASATNRRPQRLKSSRQAMPSGGGAKSNQGSQGKKQNQDSPAEPWQGSPAGDSSSQGKSQSRRQAANVPDSDDDLNDESSQNQQSALRASRDF